MFSFRSLFIENMPLWNPERERMSRRKLEEHTDLCSSYTVRYANQFSPYYHRLFTQNGIDPNDVRTRVDLRRVPITSSKTILSNQKPKISGFDFLSSPQRNVRYIETSGTSQRGENKSLFLSYDDEEIIGDVYARAFTAAGVTEEDVGLNLCPYGVNISGYAAEMGMRIIGTGIVPLGISPNPPKLSIIQKYNPTFITCLTSFMCRFTKEFENDGIDTTKLGIEK